MDTTKKRRWLPQALEQVFGCDPRSLAMFRIGLGCMILFDIVLRWPYLEAFLTDAGPVDRDTATSLLMMDYGVVTAQTWSVHFLSGDLWFQQLLMVSMGLAAVGLIVGWATWWMTLACWVLVVSMHMRCPVILSSGDTLLRCVLFWSLFTPLGACWSLDAARRTEDWEAEAGVPRRILTAGTAGLISQLICMYFFAGIAKWNIHWWEGDAMEYVFRLDLYARPWAAVMLEYPLFLKLVTWGTLFAEVVWILMLLVPWQNTWWRVSNIVIYYLLHLSIAGTMEIGLFPFISMVGWLPLFPPAFFALFNRVNQYLYWIRSEEQTATALPMEKQTETTRDWAGGLRLLGSVFATFMIGYIWLWNLANIPHTYDGDLRERLQMSEAEFASYISARQPYSLLMPVGLRWLGPLTGTGQHFQMFGVPPLHTPWFVYDATLEDGVRMDLLRTQPVSYERPASILASIQGHHWRKLHDNMLGYKLRPLQKRVAEYKLRQWNQTHREGKQVVSLKVTCFAERTGPAYLGQAPEVSIWYEWQKPIESIDDLQRLLDQNPNLLPGL